MNNRKKMVLSVVSLVLLVVLVVGITYAAFTFTSRGSKLNTIRTAKISMSYTEGENGITLENAYPIEDSVGKVLTEQDQVFDFTVNINLYGNNLPVSYEVTGEKDENSSLANEDIRIYLERSPDATSYSSVLEPSGYVPINSVDEFGASANEMVLDKGTTTETVTYHYRLRMWVGASYKVGGEEKYFTMKVNVYGNDGVTVEVNGIELDKSSANLKISNTLQLNAKLAPVSPTNKTITWTSSNPFVATVSDIGLVEVKGIGTTTITATSTNGKSATSTINVTDDCMTSSAENSCSAGTPIAYKVNDTTTQNFYVLKDNGSTLTLISDSDVATGVVWNSSGNEREGPVVATEALENATKTWTNLSSNTYNGSTGIATRARLITKAEAEEVGCKEGIKDTCPMWLVSFGGAHWTSTAYSINTGAAWAIVSGRWVGANTVANNFSGVQAVITIQK